MSRIGYHLRNVKPLNNTAVRLRYSAADVWPATRGRREILLPHTPNDAIYPLQSPCVFRNWSLLMNMANRRKIPQKRMVRVDVGLEVRFWKLIRPRSGRMTRHSDSGRQR